MYYHYYRLHQQKTLIYHIYLAFCCTVIYISLYSIYSCRHLKDYINIGVCPRRLEPFGIPINLTAFISPYCCPYISQWLVTHILSPCKDHITIGFIVIGAVIDEVAPTGTLVAVAIHKGIHSWIYKYTIGLIFSQIIKLICVVFKLVPVKEHVVIPPEVKEIQSSIQKTIYDATNQIIRNYEMNKRLSTKPRLARKNSKASQRKSFSRISSQDADIDSYQPNQDEFQQTAMYQQRLDELANHQSQEQDQDQDQINLSSLIGSQVQTHHQRPGQAQGSSLHTQNTTSQPGFLQRMLGLTRSTQKSQQAYCQVPQQNQNYPSQQQLSSQQMQRPSLHNVFSNQNQISFDPAQAASQFAQHHIQVPQLPRGGQQSQHSQFSGRKIPGQVQFAQHQKNSPHQQSFLTHPLHQQQQQVNPLSGMNLIELEDEANTFMDPNQNQ